MIEVSSKSGKGIWQTIYEILKFQPILLGSISLQNIEGLLIQSLNWRLAPRNIHTPESHPLYLFVYQRENDWIDCQKIESNM